MEREMQDLALADAVAAIKQAKAGDPDPVELLTALEQCAFALATSLGLEDQLAEIEGDGTTSES